MWVLRINRLRIRPHPVDHEDVRTTPPPLRRRVEGRAAVLADEVRDLAERTADLLSRIDELCSPSMTKAR